MAKNKKLVLAFFDSAPVAQNAAAELQEMDKAVAGIKFDSIGILVKDAKGNIKTEKLGKRHTGAGIALGAAAAVLTGGVSLIAGVLVGGVLGHLVQSGLGLSKDDLARISGQLDGGKAAVGILVDESQAAAVTSWAEGLGGKPEAYVVSEEAIQAAATAAATETEAPEAVTETAPAATEAAPAATQAAVTDAVPAATGDAAAS